MPDAGLRRASGEHLRYATVAKGTLHPEPERGTGGAVALSHRAILTPQIFRHEAEDSRQSPNAAGNRTAFVPIL
jgi:hypothetical protein